MVEIPKIMVLGDCNLPGNVESVLAHEFMASMATRDLSQVIKGPMLSVC